METYVNSKQGKVNFWIAWNTFGDNSCGTLQGKANGNYPSFTAATHIRDNASYFGNTYVGEFNLPTFIVIDGRNKYVTCMASQDHDGGSNALNIAKTATDRLLATATMNDVGTAGRAVVVGLVQKGSSLELTNSSQEAATVTLVSTQGKVVGQKKLASLGTATFANLAPARYTAVVRSVAGTTFSTCTVGE